MIRATGEVVNYNNVEIKLTITMPLQWWEQFEKVIPNDHPGWKIREMIYDVIHKVINQVNTNYEFPKE